MNINLPLESGAMADGAVTFLLEKITAMLQEEAKVLSGVKEEIEHFRDEFDRMMAFLRAAHTFQGSDPELKIWVKQVQDAAYDTEIVLDKFMLHASHNDDRGNKIGVVVSKFLGCIRQWKFNRGIASEIQRIKSRVCNVAERHQRYRYQFNMLEQGEASLNSFHNKAYDRRGDALLLEEVELVGITGRKNELIHGILEGDSKLRIVSVVGMGGLGKTTLVKQVYDDAAVRKNFQTHAWVTVSRAYHVEEMLKDIIQQLFDEIKQPVPQGLDTMDSNKLRECIKQFLQQRKFVLVFDDIWSINAWDVVRYALPNKNKGSRVIITTRLVDVASYSSVEPDGYVYTLAPLSPEESLTLFCRKTFQGSSCPPHLEKISHSILKKCAGLPLAIVAIGGLLATKDICRIEDWLVLDQSLGAELEGNDKLESLRAILLLSFSDLPYYLKYCFLYFSIYPEDHLIERNRVIRLWIAEGFVKPAEGRTMEEVAEGYVNELVNRNLLLVVKSNDDGSVKIARVHDFFREILLLISKEQDFVTTTSDQNTLWPNKVRRLSVHGAFRNIQQKRCESHLRSLLSFGLLDPKSVVPIHSLLRSCKMVTVLDLTSAPLEIFPEAVFGLLHLRYLSLRETGVKTVPKYIGKLQKLETLDLKNTNVSELPVEILKLQNLRHLLVYRHVDNPYFPYDCLLGFKAPEEIGRLASLQKLSFIEADCGSEIFTQIATLTELRRASILKLRKEDGKALCSCIEKLHKLRSLSLQAIDENEILDMQYLSSPPLFLQRLYLSGRLATFPRWIQSLHSLVKIYFRWSRLEDDPLRYLQDMPNLVHLEFLAGYIGAELCFKAGKFQKLKLVAIDKLEELHWITVEEGAVPQLEKLIIQRCNSLQGVPTGIEGLTNLRCLEFFDPPDEFMMKLRPDKLGEDFWKVAHIPEVYYIYWRNGGWEAYPLDGNYKSDNSFSPKSGIRSFGRRNWL